MGKTVDVRLDLGLTERERQVLQEASKGETVRSTALKLGLAPGTVKNHRQSAMNRLGAQTITHAVAIAMRAHIIR